MKAGLLRACRRAVPGITGGMDAEAEPSRPAVAADPASRLSPLRRLSGARIALTFDDGPDPQHTPYVLDCLGEAGARATFFVIGQQAQRHPQLIRRLLAEGHQLASHGWSHRHAWWTDAATLRQEVERAAQRLEDLSGRAVRWYRPPYGRLRSVLEISAHEQGQRIALWSRSAIDWGPWGSATGIRRRLAGIEAGDIVLLHDGRNRFNRPQATLAVLPEVLARLRREGLQTVVLGDVEAV